MTFLGDFIDGQFVKDEPDSQWEKYSPADDKDHVLTVCSSISSVNKSCEAARKAFSLWQDLGIETRKKHLLKLKTIYQKRADEIAEVISRETGKPLWESKTESMALASKIDITLGFSLDLVKTEVIENAQGKSTGVITHQARGVLCVIGPFNFPAHLANGHIIPALLMGNAVIFKPSEKTPLTGQLMAEIFKEAEFPRGVINVIHGQADISQKLCSHTSVDGVLFTGSYEVGLQIKKDTLYQSHKILALEMGGNNTSLVWEDSDINKAVYENLMGAFLTSGQRCSCTRKILVHKNIYDEFVSKFKNSAQKIQVGHWKENVFYGSLIDQDSLERCLLFQGMAQREGVETILQSEKLNVKNFKGHYITPGIHLVKKVNCDSVYQQTEIFGPSVGIYPIDSLEEALEINNSSGYGLVMSVFSKQKDIYEKCLKKARVGALNWNRSTVGASSKLPFGGRGRSGNDRPSGSFAIYYCSTPIASLEDESTFNFKELAQPIGLNYEI